MLKAIVVFKYLTFTIPKSLLPVEWQGPIIYDDKIRYIRLDTAENTLTVGDHVSIAAACLHIIILNMATYDNSVKYIILVI